MEYAVLGLLLYVLSIVVIVIPAARILHRTGFSWWWGLLSIVPIVGLIGLWLFAFSRWPLEARLHGAREHEWSDAEKATFKRLLDMQGG